MFLAIYEDEPVFECWRCSCCTLMVRSPAGCMLIYGALLVVWRAVSGETCIYICEVEAAPPFNSFIYLNWLSFDPVFIPTQLGVFYTLSWLRALSPTFRGLLLLAQVSVLLLTYELIRPQFSRLRPVINAFSWVYQVPKLFRSEVMTVCCWLLRVQIGGDSIVEAIPI